MSPTEIKAQAYDTLVERITELQNNLENQGNPTYADYAATLNGLFETVAGLDYEVSETISGQMAEYHRRLEDA